MGWNTKLTPLSTQLFWTNAIGQIDDIYNTWFYCRSFYILRVLMESGSFGGSKPHHLEGELLLVVGDLNWEVHLSSADQADSKHEILRLDTYI